MQWLKDLISAFVGALVAFYTGKISQQLKAAERELERVEWANRAAAAVDRLSDDDVVRELKKRGLYRGDEPAGNR